MINLNDTFTADGNTWVVTNIDEMEGITIGHDKYKMSISACDEVIFTYRNSKHIDWTFSFEEIEMVNAIVQEVKTWEKVTMQRII